MKEIPEIKAMCVDSSLVGSRATCIPASTDTDEDWLLLVDDLAWPHISSLLEESGFEVAGSRPADKCSINGDTSFVSFTRAELNLIVTSSPVFYKRFMAATHVAKRLNLLVKDDRIALFQAVLYANSWEKGLVEELMEEAA